jgi:hypothetical protein
MLHRVVSQKLADVSELLTASITRVMSKKRKNKFRPGLAYSYFTSSFALGFLIAMILGVVSASETSVNF